ncbi:MAG: general secretion pathway protein GspE [Geobacteraceae bacterium]|nr:general secretion pathway protein GspE [Geobacteraceae bacterium]NTW79939.1 general secretion pathway protein GspE [Geobacteraceae bacterium]
MAIKLGEMLLKEKLITPEQLDEALKSQIIFGIKLGSSLIELGFITDEQLCHFLSSKLGVPAVSPREMSWVSQDVLALVSAELAGKYRVVPIRADGKKLSLAMADPTDFKAIDEVAFVTGCVILPHIVPDVRITAALSKYYQISGDYRYLRIEGELANKQRKTPVEHVVKKAEKIEIQMMSESGELLNIEIPLEFEGFANLPDIEDGYATALGWIERYSVDRLSLEFASAKNRDQVASVFIKYLGQEFTVGALFIVRNDRAVGWRGVASGKRIEELESLNILLSKPSVIRDVLETRQFAMGILAQTPENVQLLRALGVGFSTPLLVLPIVMVKKVVAVVVVSAEMEALGKRLQELQKLVYKASLAFEMLIIKNKILMT